MRALTKPELFEKRLREKLLPILELGWAEAQRHGIDREATQQAMLFLVRRVERQFAAVNPESIAAEVCDGSMGTRIVKEFCDGKSSGEMKC